MFIRPSRDKETGAKGRARTVENARHVVPDVVRMFELECRHGGGGPAPRWLATSTRTEGEEKGRKRGRSAGITITIH